MKDTATTEIFKHETAEEARVANSLASLGDDFVEPLWRHGESLPISAAANADPESGILLQRNQWPIETRSCAAQRKQECCSDENGSEIFYDFAITPAIRFIPSYEHIWNPLTFKVTRNQRAADVFLARLAVIW